MLDVDAAWAAGMIDGDGCISLCKVSGSRFRRIELTVDSTDREILDQLQSMFDGHISSKKRYRAHHRQGWHWRLTGARKVIAALESIIPFMRCIDKRSRAELLVSEWVSVTPRNGWYTDEAADAKLDFERRFLEIGAGRGSQTLRAGGR